ncbi:MAG: hypothetical protein JHC82_10105 [Stenotrophomonas sp.]|nr:hypothetical protein [Stenotrophomonas sp.]
MLEPVQYHPAVPGIFSFRSVAAPETGSSASLAPRAVGNAPVIPGIWMAGMPCYAAHSPQGINELMTAQERGVIASDYARYGSALNNPERIVNIDPDQAKAHVSYRALCTQFQRPGDFCIRHAEDGEFILVHRSRSALSTAQLVRTPLELSANGWQLHVADTASPVWSGVRGRHFQTLEALKDALPPGMREVQEMSVGDLDVSHL